MSEERTWVDQYQDFIGLMTYLAKDPDKAKDDDPNFDINKTERRILSDD